NELEVLNVSENKSRKTFSNQHPTTLGTMESKAECLKELGCFDESLNVLSSCMKEKLRLYRKDPNNVSVARCHTLIGEIQMRKGDLDGALRSFEDALAIRVKKLGDDHPMVATSYNCIGLVLEAKGDFDGSLEYHSKALGIRIKKLGHDHPDVA